MAKSQRKSGLGTVYTGERLSRLAFPMGGIGAGMICMEGTGALSHVSLRHKPEVFNEPLMYAALHVKGVRTARVLEGPVPMWKAFGPAGTGNGASGKNYGLPRFAGASFEARFPFGIARLRDDSMPVDVELTGWSPFLPGNSDDSSLPVAALEYRLRNRTRRPVQGVFSFHAANFMKVPGSEAAAVSPIEGGFVLSNGRDPGPWSCFVSRWQISRLLSKTGPVTSAPAVRLADNQDWRPLQADGGFVNAHAVTGEADGLVYLGTRVKVSAPGAWRISVGHDGGVRVFVDGEPVAAEGALRNPAAPDRTQADVKLAAGEHEIVVALDTACGKGWGIFLRFGLPAERRKEPRPVFPEFPDGVPGGGSEEGHFAAFSTDRAAVSDCAWFRGGWFDTPTMVWNAIAGGEVHSREPHSDGRPGNGGSFYVPFRLRAGGEKTIRLLLAWYVPASQLRIGADAAPSPEECGDGCCGGDGKSESPPRCYVPWYAARFHGIAEVVSYWRREYARLLRESRRFSDCFYDSTLPPEVVEAVAANLTILKSPTCLRQHDGRFWGWEGCCDSSGCCHGSCTHVWNYAQAMPHLFPDLARTMRETEFRVSEDERGHQNFRASLPIRPPDHGFHAAADGQLGGIMQAYREWRISGDADWMKALWPRVKRSMDYGIATWDPDHAGMVAEPHHNTYDIEFWGPNGLCTSMYLGALQAAIAMGRECGGDVRLYAELVAKGRAAMETELWNGEYFAQKVRWRDLKAGDPTRYQSWSLDYSPEACVLLEQAGPKYQYGDGCLTDGVLGDWIARCCGVSPVLNPEKVTGHLLSVYRHNFRKKLSDHANPQRPAYAFAGEGGVLLCTWPRGAKPPLPFPYSDEIWTGIEYQAASHLIMMGRVSEGLRIVRTLRRRHDGRWRNPFNEYECGHWYARAMASYGLIQALSGARYDAVEKTLYLRPALKGDFRAFLSTATGYGVVGIRKGKPFCEVKSGRIPLRKILTRNGGGRSELPHVHEAGS